MQHSDLNSYIGSPGGTTELMKNHKAAKLLSEQSSFETLQTQNGNSILFCTNSDKSLNLMVERSGSKTGWIIQDLTSDLSRSFGKIYVKSFSLTQNINDGSIYLAVLATDIDGDNSLLFVLFGMSYKDGSEWMFSADARPWKSISFEINACEIRSMLLAPFSESLPTFQYMIVQAGVCWYVRLLGDTVSGWELVSGGGFMHLLSEAVGYRSAGGAGLYQLGVGNDSLPHIIYSFINNVSKGPIFLK